MKWIRVLAFAALVPAAAAPVTFPRDHGAHLAVPVEWWYYTGHLSDGAGRSYGFQLTFFRVRDVHLAHFAWTDVSRREFRYVEKTHLGLPGIASASEQGLDVSNEDWSAREGPGGTHALNASGPDGELELTLTPVKAPVLHGENGLSRKGAGAGEFSRMLAENPSDRSFMDQISGAPVVVDQWQLEKLGLVWDVVRISPERQARKALEPAGS